MKKFDSEKQKKEDWIDLVEFAAVWLNDEERLDRTVKRIIKENPDLKLRKEDILDKGIYLRKEHKSKLLKNSNIIDSPIKLENELPVIELFFDSYNFMLLTTRRIYNCRKEVFSCYLLEELKSFEDKSFDLFLDKRSQGVQFAELSVETKSNEVFEMVVETGVPFDAISLLLFR